MILNRFERRSTNHRACNIMMMAIEFTSLISSTLKKVCFVDPVLDVVIDRCQLTMEFRSRRDLITEDRLNLALMWQLVQVPMIDRTCSRTRFIWLRSRKFNSIELIDNFDRIDG